MMDDVLKLEDFKLCLLAIWKRRIIIIAISVLFFLVSILITLGKEPVQYYSAMATVYSAFYGSYEESVDGAAAMNHYSELVSTKKVCERAAAMIGDSRITAEDVQEMIYASSSPNSVIMSISASSLNPETAIKVANAVADAFVIEIRTITGSEAIQLLDGADSYYIKSSGLSEVWIPRMFAGAAGFTLPFLFFFFKELFSNKIRSVGQCISDEDDKLLVIIPLAE